MRREPHTDLAVKKLAKLVTKAERPLTRNKNMNGRRGKLAATARRVAKHDGLP
jgi:hypothetical protein